MRHLTIAGALLLSAFFTVSSLVAAPSKQAPKKNELVYCSMMDMPVAKSKAFGKTTVKGKTYYFCCKACKAGFDKNPTKNAIIADKKIAAWKKSTAKSAAAKPAS